MLRVALLVALPILAPTLLYLLWLQLARRRAIAAGAAPPTLGEAPWVLLAGIGVGLAVLALGASMLFFEDNGAPGDRYVPPHVIDGRVVPGHSDHKP